MPCGIAVAIGPDRGARRPCPRRDCPAAPSRRPGCAPPCPAACPGLARWSAGCSRPARCKDALCRPAPGGNRNAALGQLGLLPEQDAEILQAGPVIGQTAASHGGAGAAVAGLGIGQVDQAVLGEIRRQGHVEQAALPLRGLGYAFKGADRPPGNAQQPQIAGAFGDEDAIGQKGHGPGMLQAARHGRDLGRRGGRDPGAGRHRLGARGCGPGAGRKHGAGKEDGQRCGGTRRHGHLRLRHGRMANGAASVGRSRREAADAAVYIVGLSRIVAT